VPTYRLTLEYEGTRYRGWQEQQNARSVAGELRRAIADSGVVIKDLGGAGRTDAGVHALAQVAHLRLAEGAAGIEPEPFRRAVNDRLPPDIHLLAVTPAPADFHARHSAVTRSYVYQVSRRRTALAKRFVWWVKSPLDVRRMGEAASQVVGRHDFRLFCERPAEQTSTLVVVEGAEVVADGALILVRLVASHFLWKMVRRVVGTLVEVGSGRLPPAAFAALVSGAAGERGRAAGSRGPAGQPAEWTAPPSGLFLERVLYPGDPPLTALSAPVPVAGEPGRAG
jgi:tRNA pseudouridine38-40 synthase